MFNIFHFKEKRSKPEVCVLNKAFKRHDNLSWKFHFQVYAQNVKKWFINTA